jgi:hypothetical protein
MLAYQIFFELNCVEKISILFRNLAKVSTKNGEYVTKIYLILALTSTKKLAARAYVHIQWYDPATYYNPTMRFIHPFFHPMSIEGRRGILGLEAAIDILFYRIARLPWGSRPASFSFPSVA